MKTYTLAELAEILERHKHWLNKDCDGWKAMRADLRNADLWGAVLRDAFLRDADLRGAVFSNADLRGADLSGADLRGAGLRGADLRNADFWGSALRGADLSGADLRGADLRGADLRGSGLRGSDLSNANLKGTVLSNADLRGSFLRGSVLRNADLRGSDLRNADFRGADLRGAKIPGFLPMACPDTGSFVGWKKARGQIVKLLIPEDARRSSATSRKCRCDKAEVLEIQNPDGSPSNMDAVCSNYSDSFVYKVGETVTEPGFYEDRFEECAPGIHFFINRQEAVDY